MSVGTQVDALADETFAAFGAVHFLFNNADISDGGPNWENSFADWDWVLGDRPALNAAIRDSSTHHD